MSFDAVPAGQRRGVDADGHRQARVVEVQDRERPRVVGVGQGLADRDLGQAGDGDDLARSGLGSLDAVERLGDVQAGDLDPFDRPVGPAPGDRFTAHDRAVVHPAQREPAEVRRGVEVGHLGLQRVPVLVGRRRDVLEDRLEQGPQVAGQLVGRRAGDAGAGVAVDDRELDLALVGVEVQEQLVGLVDHGGRAGVGPVDLVDHQDHRQPGLERLAQHEAGLRQRALAGVDQQQHPVDHRQPALDLAAEVGVARRVDDVDLDVAPADGRVLGQDRDALLALQVHRVHDPLVDVLVRAEGPGLPQHRVDERGLPVVDVGDDRHVAQVVALRHGTHSRRGRVITGCSPGLHRSETLMVEPLRVGTALATGGATGSAYAVRRPGRDRQRERLPGDPAAPGDRRRPGAQPGQPASSRR